MRARLGGAFALVLAACGYENRYLDRHAGFGGEHVTGLTVSDVPVNGHHVVVLTADEARVEGELLAADRDRVYVLEDGDKGAIALAWPSVEEVRIVLVPSRPGEPAGTIIWTTVGALSTLSHGWFLVLTVPVWLGAGIPTSIVHGRAMRARVTQDELRQQLYQFARYPQGLPRRTTSDAGAGDAARP